MADNTQTQSATPATLSAGINVATVEATFSSDTVQAGVGVLAKSSGSEGSRTLTLINPATEDKQDTGNTSLSSIDGKTPSLGQALAAASTPVVLTAAQVTTLTPPAAITGYSTETTLGTRLSESDFDTKTGSLTETAPATDTASSGLNGRLQRIAQRLSSLITAMGSPFQAGGSIGNTTFASTQSGTWTVQPGNTANTTAWKVDGSAVTQPVSGTVTATVGTVTAVTTVGTITNVVHVDDNAGSLTVDGTVTASNAAGDVAHDGVDSGNPVKVGGKAASAAPTAVAAADRVNALFDLWGRLGVRSGEQAPVASTFTQMHVPATNVQATKTQASAGAGKRNVCTGFTVTLAGGASAPTAAAPITVAIIDGATGGTTYLWRTIIGMPATAGGIVSFNRSGLWLVGSQATALTVEFSAAGGTNTYQSVSMDGVVVEE